MSESLIQINNKPEETKKKEKKKKSPMLKLLRELKIWQV